MINVGTATLAAYINGGGLGTLIVAGFSTNRFLVSLTGAVLTAVLALLVDHLAGIAEDILKPKGPLTGPAACGPADPPTHREDHDEDDDTVRRRHCWRPPPCWSPHAAATPT